MRVSLVDTVSVPIAGCAALSVSGTPAQALARERWRGCDHFPALRLDRIEASGRVLLNGRETEGAAARAVLSDARPHICLAQGLGMR
jgi:hypothetical protein